MGALGDAAEKSAPLSLACWERGGRNSASPQLLRSLWNWADRRSAGRQEGPGEGPARRPQARPAQRLLPPTFRQVKPVVSQFLREKQLPYNEDTYLARFRLFLSRYEELLVHAPPITELAGLQ